MTSPADSQRAIRELAQADLLEMVERIARGYGYSVEDIVGARRFQGLAYARRQCILLVHEARPHLSTTELGVLFGREHTTILWSLGRLAKARPRTFARRTA